MHGKEERFQGCLSTFLPQFVKGERLERTSIVSETDHRPLYTVLINTD